MWKDLLLFENNQSVRQVSPPSCGENYSDYSKFFLGLSIFQSYVSPPSCGENYSDYCGLSNFQVKELFICLCFYSSSYFVFLFWYFSRGDFFVIRCIQTIFPLCNWLFKFIVQNNRLSLSSQNLQSYCPLNMKCLICYPIETIRERGFELLRMSQVL